MNHQDQHLPAAPALERRHSLWSKLSDNCFDAVVIGGGINGASIYRALADSGRQVLLFDKGDFAGGTSQASAMMVWGGILYLRNWHLGTVKELCRARDQLVRQWPDMVRIETFRYIPTLDDKRNHRVVQAGMMLYWLLGGCRTLMPRLDRSFSEQALLNGRTTGDSMVWQEGTVRPSDARFVLGRLGLDQPGPSRAMNYCTVDTGQFNSRDGLWHVGIRDSILEKEKTVKARCIINAAGIWTDHVNQQFGMSSPYRHVMSKGVFVGLPRDPRHENTLLFESGGRADAMALLPWGPISLWGPTETVQDGPLEDAYRITSDDVELLLSELNRNLHTQVSRDDVISMRCGVRPLVVRNGRKNVEHSLDLTRGQRVVVDRRLPWISVYGGKLTSCQTLGKKLVRAVKRLGITKTNHMKPAPQAMPKKSIIRFGAFDESFLSPQFLSPQWCLEHESCWSLEDYLRRRTNIAQWVDRGGLGRNNENRDQLADIAAVFERARGLDRGSMLHQYEKSMADTFDRILQRSHSAQPVPVGGGT
jgi:glycerol-3-phosphate dehydrogenase